MDARSSPIKHTRSAKAEVEARRDPVAADQPAVGADFEQAKNPAEGARFLQIVAKPKRAVRKKSEPKLTRVAFRVSRLMEFCSIRELQNQTGHAIYDWPLVVAKELIDNALDACEEAEVAPAITVIVDSGTIIIEDNAGGIDTATIKSILDYTIRVSSREAYVSPTRGAQGNALKTILAMGYVLDRKIGSDADAAGITIIETRGIEHRIEFRVDHVNNQPKIIHTTAESPVKVGTRLSIKWPPKDHLLECREDGFKQLIEVLRLVQSASELARQLVRARIHQRAGNQSALGEMAAAQSDQRPLVRRDQAAALSGRACRAGS